MPKLTINAEFIKPYWDGTKRHRNYAKAVDVAHHVQFHFDGYFQRPLTEQAQQQPNMADYNKTEPQNPYFTRLIDIRRPSESVNILAYRRMQYLPVTKVPCGKVVNSLAKIVKSSDWKIDYSKSKVPPSLPEPDSLQEYCEKKFPTFKSIEHWAYSKLIRWTLIDPNGACVVMPLSFEIQANEYYEPFPHIIRSCDVYDYKDREWIVFLSPYTSEWIDKNGTTQIGKILTVVDRENYYNFVQVGDNSFRADTHPHNIGEMPAFLLGGEDKSPDIHQPYYESFIMGMLPSLDAAARDASDLDAEKVQHLFSTMWYIQGQSCAACQGTGSVQAQGKQTVCQSCEGRGALPKSPYRDLEINLNSIDATGKNIPTPPAGYITKPTEMVGLMRNEITIEIHDALAAINMEFLAEEPLNESGKAKEVDRDELNNFVYKIAYHVVESEIKRIYYFNNEIRYMESVPDKSVRELMLPTIPVPQNYDFLTSKDAEDKVIKIADSQVSAGIKDAAEMNYIHQRFADQPEVRNRLILIHDHDPLPSYPTDLIESMVASNLVTKLDAVLSLYIETFVTQILSTNQKFIDKEFNSQKEELYTMAKNKLALLDKAAEEEIKRMASQKLDAEGNPIQTSYKKKKTETVA